MVDATQAFTQEALLQAANDYLSSLNATLFGRAFDISRPSGRKQAAQWLVDQLNDVNKQVVINYYADVQKVLDAAASNGHDGTKDI